MMTPPLVRRSGVRLPSASGKFRPEPLTDPDIGTFGLAVAAANAFSLGVVPKALALNIAGKVLPFQTGACLSFVLPTRRMPLGPSQDIVSRVNGAMTTAVSMCSLPSSREIHW